MFQAVLRRPLQVELADEAERQLHALRHDRAEFVLCHTMVLAPTHKRKETVQLGKKSA